MRFWGLGWIRGKPSSFVKDGETGVPARLRIGRWPGEDARRSIMSESVAFVLIYHGQQRLGAQIAAQVLREQRIVPLP